MSTTRRKHLEIGDGGVTRVMSRLAVVVRDRDPLDHVLRAYAMTGLRHLAVVDDTGACVGLISDRTVTAAWVRDPMLFDRLTAGQLLDDRAPIVRDDETVRLAARVMHACGTDAVVVVDDGGRPVGLLTAADLVGLLARSQPA
ncbi:CBS domain-containing protein [Hamadaea tsunoensis]|uniref:CBS domain-containing protein n=1 Tax=Hamadaea tsunoensis TaxID=53368 RepID=UPI00047F336A|nr:CBS domain-containing protein [Hamadaea tsunoensis]